MSSGFGRVRLGLALILIGVGAIGVAAEGRGSRAAPVLAPLAVEAERSTRPERALAPADRVPVGSVSVPVLLVPGWFDTARDLAALRIRLVNSGWPSTHVATVTFEEPTGSNRDHAEELRVAVAELLEQSGAQQVDIVAHSMGGLATRWYLLQEGGEAPVRRVAFIATPHRGTLSAHFAWGGGRDEMMPESPFLDTLNSRAPVPQGVEVITVRTTVDTHVVPGENATLPGVTDHKLCCPTHAGLLHHDEVYDIVRRFLDALGRP